MNRTCIGRHCEAGKPVDTRPGIDTSALEYDSTTKKLLNKCKNIIFEAKLRELSMDRCGTSRHCEAGRPVATDGQH